MKFDRTVSTNVTSVGRQNPDDRQDYNDANYLDALRSENKMIDSPPMPRPDPRDQIKNAKGFGAPSGTYGDLSGRIADEVWVRDHQSDFGDQKNGNFLGMTLWRHENPEAAQFLLDTFKRARSVGYPIGPLLPILHGYPSSTFGDAAVEPFDPNQENN